LEAHLERHWKTIESKLRAGSYQPSPVRPVVIGKPDGGERELGIPTTQDRLIQQALTTRLVEVFEPTFHLNSFGYRPGRSGQQAALEMRRQVVEEKRGVVIDLDIRSFFDEVNHDVLMREVKREVANKEVLKLIGKYLRAGKLVGNRKVRAAGKGMPQGGPLSPVLANIYLHPLDLELEKRGLPFVRYADDVVVFVRSERSAIRVIESLSAWIAKHLKLEVNRTKSGYRDPWEGNFLGFRVERDGRLALSKKSVSTFCERVKTLLDARVPRRWKELIADWQKYIRGWAQYFKVSEWYEFGDLSGWCRRHIRKLCWLRWHNWRGRRNAFTRLGAKPKHMRMAHCSRGAWRMARHPALQSLLNNQRLREWGFVTPSDLVGSPS
jgi:group II intron reverse transcriptase/maturase